MFYLDSTWYNVDWPLLILIFMFTLMLTISLLAINSFFSPKQLIAIIKETNELKKLDQKIADNVKAAGFITKLIFRIFGRGAERYYS